MTLRHSLIAFALLACASATLPAQATLRVAASGRATTEVAFSYPRDSAPPGFKPASLKIDYGQPHLRGRTLHTDSLVPFGTHWRTGANDPTTLVTGLDLVVGGQPLAAGTYVLWTLPTSTGWTLVVQKPIAPGTTQQAGTYYAVNDVARIALRQRALGSPVESLTMTLVPATGRGTPRGELRIEWATTSLATDWSVR